MSQPRAVLAPFFALPPAFCAIETCVTLRNSRGVTQLTMAEISLGSLVLGNALDEGEYWDDIVAHFDVEGFLEVATAVDEKLLSQLLHVAAIDTTARHLVPLILAKSRDPDALCLKMIKRATVNEVNNWGILQSQTYMEAFGFSGMRDHPDYPDTIAALQKHLPQLVPAVKGAQ